MPIDENSLKRLQEDINVIRATMERNRGLLREVLLPVRFRILSIATGLLIVLICALLYWAERSYNGLHNMPGPLQIAVGSVIVVLFVAGSVIKNRSEVRAARRIDPDYSFWSLHRDLLRRPIVVHSLLSGLLILAGLCVHLVQLGQTAYIVPLAAVTTGLLYNVYGASAGIALYYLPGYWFIAAGLFTVFVGPVHVLVSTAYIFGAGFIVFGLAIFAGNNREG